jgi:starch synthase
MRPRPAPVNRPPRGAARVRYGAALPEVPVQIVQLSSEIAPWSKVGGLGDVCGALPAALAARGHRVVTVAPLYKAYDDVDETRWRGGAWLYGRHHEVRFHHTVRAGVTHLFVDHPSFRRSGIYGDAHGGFGDNLFRFALLTRAALQVPDLPLPGGALGDDVVFHANDWHTALAPTFLDAVFRPAGRFLRAPCVLALHNVAHHGAERTEHFEALDLPARWFGTLDAGGAISPLKAGVSTADQLITVSPTYAREIATHQGYGLEPILAGRWGDLHGIVNGVGDDWDPATDPRLPARFDADDLSGKAVCKRALQEAFGLTVDPRAPIVGFVGRLVYQKGVDLLQALVPWLVAQGAQVVLLGSGQPEYEQFFLGAPARFPGRVGTWVGYDEDRAHLIEAGSDLFVMPSRFEPCGLNQLYSLRYGTIPVVHATGGLVDTVSPIDAQAGEGTGYRFSPHDVGPFRRALEHALGLYRDFPEAWDAAVQRGMRQRFGWERAAEGYELVYERAIARRAALAGAPLPAWEP